MRCLPLTLLPLVLAACERDPVAPARSEPLSRPVFAAYHEKGEGVFVASGDYVLDCLGETVREEHTEIRFRYHFTVTPSGRSVLVDPFIPGTATGTLVGLTSGTVWALDRVISPEVILVTAGQVHTFTANIWWVSETGPTLNVHSLFHMSTNADGEITSAKVDLGTCRLH
jgi:hypothetical protein